MRTKKGGLFGKRKYKLKRENRTNCYRLSDKYKKKFNFLYDLHRCSENHNEICTKINERIGLNRYCADDYYVENYDFSGDGKRVKRRTEPFLDLSSLPQNVIDDPWKKMDTYFIKSNDEYILKD